MAISDDDSDGERQIETLTREQVVQAQNEGKPKARAMRAGLLKKSIEDETLRDRCNYGNYGLEHRTPRVFYLPPDLSRS